MAIIVKTKYGTDLIRDSTMKKMGELVRYLLPLNWVSFSSLVSELNFDYRTLKEMVFVLWSMKVLDFRSKVFKNHQNYLVVEKKVRIKPRTSKGDIGIRFIQFFDEDGNFLAKKYYSDEKIWGKRLPPRI